MLLSYFLKVLLFFIIDLGDCDEYILKLGFYMFYFFFVLFLEILFFFEGEYGYVCYIVKGIIDRSWSFNDYIKCVFIVIGLLDFNKLLMVDVSSCKNFIKKVL